MRSPALNNRLEALTLWLSRSACHLAVCVFSDVDRFSVEKIQLVRRAVQRAQAESVGAFMMQRFRFRLHESQAMRVFWRWTVLSVRSVGILELAES